MLVRLIELPGPLREAIDRELSRSTAAALASPSNELTIAYRSPRAPALHPGHLAAYLTTRLPATYAATRSVLGQLTSQLPEAVFESALDLGSGPGTAAWAALDQFPGLKQVTLVERDAGMIDLAKRLARQGDSDAFVSPDWLRIDLERGFDPTEHDITLISYLLGELSDPARTRIVTQSWRATKAAIAIVEPGTPAGFARVRQARDQLIGLGGIVLAPCPHQQTCPIQEGDWCHFAARLERSSLHRRVKGATLPYEDEKYSYVIAAKQGGATGGSRIVRRPHKATGHVNLNLCTESGKLVRMTVTRKHGLVYKDARKADWGDHWDA
jgi:ribosomal protein RSM22 (predicted rRNA methylase)